MMRSLPSTVRSGSSFGGSHVPLYSFQGFQPVATAEAQPDFAARSFGAHVPLTSVRSAIRQEVPEGPDLQARLSAWRWCCLALAVAALAGGSAAVALVSLQPHGRWQRLIPRLALPQGQLQVKSDSNKAFHLAQTGLSNVPKFRAIGLGTCDDYAFSAIRDFFSCRAAAADLRLLEAGFPITWDERAGCHYWSGHSTHRICAVPASVQPGAESPAAAQQLGPNALAGKAGVRQPGQTAEELGPGTYGEVPNPSTTPAFLPAIVEGVTTTTQQCGMMELGREYPGNDLYVVDSPSAESCCQTCTANPQCLLWTWREESIKAPALCFLKGSEPRSAVTRLRRNGSASGRQERSGGHVQVRDARPGLSLFCFSLAMPFGYERSLLALQYVHHASIFACDEYAVYSNISMEVAPAVKAGAISSDLVCKRGGEFGTALNTDIFLKVWAKVAEDGRFRLHDWTVKVDPDAVFIPSRLRTLLAKHNETQNGTYLNNCKFGMHGPIEVLSRNAVKSLVAGSDKCMQHFIKLCSGKCQWGEDMFVDQCLMRVLRLKRANEYKLLLEDHCDPPSDWSSCQDAAAAAFHPFKTEKGYRRCLANATG